VQVPNYLKTSKLHQVIALLELGWTYRRIEAETGVRRETISRYDRARRAKAAKVFPGSGEHIGEQDSGFAGSDPAKAAKVTAGSDSKAAKVFPGSSLPPRSSAARYRDTILTKLESGLSVQRIWQDLVEEYGFGYSYEAVKRFVRKLPRRRRAAGVLHSAPGEEGQVDFFQGAPTLDEASGQWKRPWVFRLTLAHSRHGYEEAVWDQSVETFLRLHENAFADLGGVPRVVRHDNLKAAVVRACLYDPDINEVYAAFSRHWGFTPLPTRPRNPQENGKQERSGGYVKDNALKGRRFNSLAEHNEHLRRWNRTVARLRIHGTTRRQVIAHFLEAEKPALQPLAPEPFGFFRSGDRTIHPDGHVEVDGAFYPAPLHLLGQKVRVRWDRNLVRLYHGETQVAVYKRLRPGQFAPRSGEPAGETSSQVAFTAKLLARCEQVGLPLRQWAEAALEERGVRALRLIQGVLSLTRLHPREQVLAAARTATTHRLFRYKDLHRLAQQSAARPVSQPLLAEHPSIRPITDYRLEDFL
jgi:transposase